MICPKCGRPVDENAVICRGCDFILDTEFLGDGILDEEHSLRPGAGGVDPAAFNLADAVILGNIDDDSQSFETSDSGFHLKANLSARLYVSGRSQALMSPDAVPALAQSAEGVRLTPFEKHVLAFIDGKKPVEVIRRAAGLDEAEVKTALATLADKGVVKVVGRALADFDPGNETAARRAPPRHRMRGSVVGAVALVGDEADRAIEEAFRTQVAIAAPVLGRGAAPEGDVFQSANAANAANAASMRDGDLPSDVEQFVGLKGTDEIEKQRRVTGPGDNNALIGASSDDSVEHPTTSSTVRPSALKPAINRAGVTGRIVRAALPPANGSDSQEGIDASADASAVERSLADPEGSEASDGFDDFGQPSDVSTAVVARAFSQSSSDVGPGGPAAGGGSFAERPRSGVFADISDADELPSVQNLADSRVVRRPDLGPARPSPGLASEMSSSVSSAGPGRQADERRNSPPRRGKRPRLLDDRSDDSSADSSGGGPGDSPSVEAERQAASGEVWEENRAAPPRGGTAATGLLSASLSDLLSESEGDGDGERTANVPPERAREMLGGGDSPSSAGSFEEPTVAGQPMPPLPLPLLGRQPDPPAAPAPAPLRPPPRPPTRSGHLGAGAPARAEEGGKAERARLRPAAMVSLPDEGAIPASELDERSGLHDVDRLRMPRGAASELFDDDADGLADPPTSRQKGLKASDDSTGDLGSSRAPPLPQPSEPSASAEDAGVSAERSVHRDETVPPSRLPSSERGAAQSEEPARARAGVGASPEHPDDADDADDADESQGDGSVELVDSGLVIRPAAKAVPLTAAARAARASRPRAVPDLGDAAVDDDRGQRGAAAVLNEGDANDVDGGELEAGDVDAGDVDAGDSEAGDIEAGDVEVGDGEVGDVEATVTLDAGEQGRRFGGRHVAVGGRPGAVAAIPSGFSRVVSPTEGARARPTDENRRKARNLFDEAQKEAAAGRLGAARMNAKLASIYDPENETYRRQLEAWERPATSPRPRAATTPSAEAASRVADESQAEIKALYDEAQRHEDSGDVDGALDVLEQGVQRFPNAAAFHNRLGVILALRKRDYENAVQAIQRAIDIDPDNLHYKSNLGKIVAKMRRGSG